MDRFFLPTYDESWAAVSWVTFYLFVALVGQRAPDDRLYERTAEGAVLKRPAGLPRAARPGVAAAVAALLGGASFLVARDGGWAARASALALGVTLACTEAAATWAQQHYVWLRLALALRWSCAALAGAVVGTYGAVRALAALFALPALLWALYAAGDCALLWWWNRAAVPSELEDALEDLRTTSLDPLPAPPVHAARD